MKDQASARTQVVKTDTKSDKCTEDVFIHRSSHEDYVENLRKRRIVVYYELVTLTGDGILHAKIKVGEAMFSSNSSHCSFSRGTV